MDVQFKTESLNNSSIFICLFFFFATEQATFINASYPENSSEIEEHCNTICRDDCRQVS